MARQSTSQIEKGLNSASRTGFLADKVVVVTGAGRGIGRSIEVNVIGVYNTIHAATPYLRKRGGGKIIVTGSGTRYRANIGRSDYASAKSAAWMMVQILGLELQEFNISVNELIPGPVKTALTQFGDRKFSPGEWIKEPEDVVPMALFLASQPDNGPTSQSFSLMRRAP
jgi:3-oxoacyl-[acyl-carrier protein] reductase